MKKIISFCLLFAVSVSVFSQTVTTMGSTTQSDYLKKSKHQKTAAWILFSGGTTLTTIGCVLALNDFGTGLGNIVNPHSQSVSNGAAAAVFAVTGITSIIASIPLFISASKNKHKALSITFKNDFVPELQNAAITKMPVSEISMVVRF